MRTNTFLNILQRKIYNNLRQADPYTGANSTVGDARRIMRILMQHR